MDEVIKFRHPPVKTCRLVPQAIKPERARLMCHKFPYLGLFKLKIMAVGCLQGVFLDAAVTFWVIRPYPVYEGIIVLHPHPAGLHGGGKFRKGVPPERRTVHYVEAALTGSEHGKAVVVTGGEGDITRPGVGEGLRPGIGIKL